jgi:hypothetical protein
MRTSEEEKKKGTDEIFEVIMAHSFPNLMKDNKPQTREFRKRPPNLSAWIYHVGTVEYQRQRKS